MAIGTPTEVAFAVDSGSTTSVTTGSFSPSPNSILLVFSSTNDLADVTVSDTLTGTSAWSSVYEAELNSGGISHISMRWALTGAAPGTGTVTTSCAASCRWSTSVVEVTGLDTTTPIVQSATNTGVSSVLTVTLGGAPAAKNLLIAALSSRDLTPTVDTGYTEFVDRETGGSNKILNLAHNLSPSATNHQWTTLSSFWTNSGLLVEFADGGSFIPKIHIF